MPDQDNKTPAQAAVQFHSAKDYFNGGRFQNDVNNFVPHAYGYTGYGNLDCLQPLYPGLYVLGAISSLGKTTFIHQMASNRLSTTGSVVPGYPVLYFSLEQSEFELRFELRSKSLSRGFFLRQQEEIKKNGTYPTYTSIALRRGEANGTQELQEVIDNYVNTVEDHMTIYECNFSVTVEDIEKIVDEYIEKTKIAPVVVIDYLQIISPTLINGRQPDAKSAVDHIVHEIKCFQVKHNLTVILISSLNRMNYMTPIDFESFKESGGIEYTADVIWGLQLSVLNTPLFEKEGRIKEKRDDIRNAKAQIPREIELVILKNRYGRTGITFPFEYFPQFDTIRELPLPLGHPLLTAPGARP